MASEKWAGFTDEDIERIKTHPVEPLNGNNNQDLDNGLYVKDKVGPMKIKELAAAFKQNNLDTSKDETSDSDVKRKSTRSKKNLKAKEPSVVSKSVDDDKNMYWEKNEIDLSDESCISSDNSKKEENTEEKVVETNLNFHELEEFELRQKRIEAENARRRALISKAINDKKMQTLAEAVKLAKITQELDRLDSILSADVSILRDYIEKATFEFSEAEKRYLKAEKEFIESKLHLYEKMQRKEQLTEHLCAIIEQNENRKADKLVELMKQLEMEAVIENLEANESHRPILSNFCALNNETYHCCQTFKPYPKASPDTASLPQNTSKDKRSCEQAKSSDLVMNSNKTIENTDAEKLS